MCRPPVGATAIEKMERWGSNRACSHATEYSEPCVDGVLFIFFQEIKDCRGIILRSTSCCPYKDLTED